MSNAHSASVTASPPSEQSCAERSSPARAAPRQQRDQRALAVEIERRRRRRDQAVDDLQILAAAELAEILAEQDDRVARRAGTSRASTRVASSISPTTPMTGVG